MQTCIYTLVFYFLMLSPTFFDISHSQVKIGEISLPSEDFQRVAIKHNSFAHFLRQLPLKKPGSDVINYRGGIFKSGADTSVAFVVDMDIKGRRLEQCMDVLVRFYAEYILGKGQVANFQLPLPGGYWLKWNEWSEGFRPVFNGIEVKMVNSAKPDTSKNNFKTYLNIVYSESHTQQFYHSYRPVENKNVQIGDIIIKKGTKGHAIMIVDLATNEQGQLIALIGNGDTPACQFFLLNYRADSPWVLLNFDEESLDLPLNRKMTWDGLRRFDLPKVD